MEYKTVKVSKEKKVATIEINRPDVLNAFNTQLIFDLQEATQLVKDDDNIRVVIICGSGRAFSSGADLTEADSDWDGSKDALLRGFKPSFENIISMPKPVIASIKGPAAGIGAAFAMSCDLRIMSEDAYILSVFSNIALVPDGGLSWLLPKYLGYGKAYEYAIEAKKIDAKGHSPNFPIFCLFNSSYNALWSNRYICSNCCCSLCNNSCNKIHY